MFGTPVAVNDDDTIFCLVWTYGIKAVDGRKKAWCVCDGSTGSGMVCVLAETHAIVSIKQVPTYFTLLPPLRIYRYMAPTSPACWSPTSKTRIFHFPRLCFSMSGGSNINGCQQFHPVISFQFFWHAGPSGIPMTLGETCGWNSLRNWAHPDHSWTMPLLY